MSINGTVDVPIEIFGGLVTDIAPADLPAGLSPDCQDVVFSESGVRTRPGLQSVYSAIAGNPTINYLKIYQNIQQQIDLLLLDSNGTLWHDSGGSSLSAIATALAPGAYAHSATLFDREYMGFSDGKAGLFPPRHFDGTYLDRVSQQGPGAAPSVMDESASPITIAASPNGAKQPTGSTNITGIGAVNFMVTVTTSADHGLTGIEGAYVTIAGVPVPAYNGFWRVSQVISTTQFMYYNPFAGSLSASSGGTCTSKTARIETSAAHGFVVGQKVIVAGVTITGYNGTWTITFVGSSTRFSYECSTGGLAASGSGTATTTGTIVAGVHKVTVLFQTRSGSLTAPAPPTQWTAAGSKRAVLSAIPTGPPNVQARIVCFTPSGGSRFYYISAEGAQMVYTDPSTGLVIPGGEVMVIPDNTTTSATFDFTDTDLQAGTSADALFKLVELGECGGVTDYADRLFWWGERNKINNLVNLGFDGGFTGPNFPHYPLGWQGDVNYAAGGTDEQTNAVWGAAYAIATNGTSDNRGWIFQSAYRDFAGAPILEAGRSYSVRVRLAKNAALTQGTFKIFLTGTGISGTGLQVTAAQLGTSYTEFTAELTAALTTIPANAKLNIMLSSAPVIGGYAYCDCIEVFPTDEPVNSSLVRVSKADDPESYDGVTGLLSISENNGQAIRSAFKLRERLFFVKEHSIYATQDDPAQEPSGWSISEISPRVGTPSVRGVATAEDWAVIAHQSGLYIFFGQEPMKISQEIQPLWNTINWQYGHTLWVVVDTKERRIFVGAPVGAATSPNKLLVLDYRDLDSADQIAARGPVHVTGKGTKGSLDKTRKWAPWIISAKSAAPVLKPDGTSAVYFGNGAGNGKIYQLSSSQLSDDDAAIASYYTTSFLPDQDTELALQLRTHRKLFTYLTMLIEGSGSMSLTAYRTDLGNSQALNLITLSSPPTKDAEMMINIPCERVAFKVATSAAGAWLRLQRFTACVTPDPWAPVRGA